MIPESPFLRESEQANLDAEDRRSALACYAWSAIGVLLVIANLVRWWMTQ